MIVISYMFTFVGIEEIEIKKNEYISKKIERMENKTQKYILCYAHGLWQWLNDVLYVIHHGASHTIFFLYIFFSFFVFLLY